MCIDIFLFLLLHMFDQATFLMRIYRDVWVDLATALDRSYGNAEAVRAI